MSIDHRRMSKEVHNGWNYERPCDSMLLDGREKLMRSESWKDDDGHILRERVEKNPAGRQGSNRLSAFEDGNMNRKKLTRQVQRYLQHEER